LPESLCGLTSLGEEKLNLECNELDSTSVDVASCFEDFLGSQLSDPNCSGN